jgi:hypothetical protein
MNDASEEELTQCALEVRDVMLRHGAVGALVLVSKTATSRTVVFPDTAIVDDNKEVHINVKDAHACDLIMVLTYCMIELTHHLEVLAAKIVRATRKRHRWFNWGTHRADN